MDQYDATLPNGYEWADFEVLRHSVAARVLEVLEFLLRIDPEL